MSMRKLFLLVLATAFVNLLVFVAVPTATLSFTCTPEVQWRDNLGGTWSTLVVVNLTDDNGDGVVDACDAPEVALITGDSNLRVVHGTTGGLHFQVDPGFSIFPFALAAADIVGDSVAELILLDFANDSAKVVAFDSGGTKVVDGPFFAYTGYRSATISVANLDTAGGPEILVGEMVFDSVGNMLWDGDDGYGTGRGVLGLAQIDWRTSTGVDLDMDGKLEVLAGNTAYRSNGTVFWTFLNPDTVDGASAVGNFDGDPFPEVVFVYQGKDTFDYVQLLDSVETSSPKAWGSAFRYATGNIGTLSKQHCGVFPSLGQFDSDAQPEVAETNGDTVFALDFNTTTEQWGVKWRVNVDDRSGNSGISLADLDGDGFDEVIYRDHDSLRIIDGSSGSVEFITPMSSGTGLDYPVVADIDGDNKMEVVTTSNSGPTIGLWAFECDTWVDGRRVWNDYTYHVTNINEDGTVPVHQESSWLTHNSFLAQENECVMCDKEVSGDWTIEIVKDETSGPYNAIALRDNSFPHIGFHDESEGGLWYAFKDTILPPWCPRYPQWKIVQVEPAQAGHWTSIDILSGLTRAEFSHVDSSNWNIQWAADVGVDSLGCGITLDRYELDTAGDLGSYGTDLAIDTSRNQTSTGIVYYHGTRENLKYAERTEAGWNLVTLDSDGDVGRYPAIAIDASGRRHVSYYDASNGDLRYIMCNPTAGSCTIPPGGFRSGWGAIDIVDSSGVVGLFTEITIDNSRNPHISYIDSTNKSLKYAKKDGDTWFLYVAENEANPQDLIASTSIGVDDNSPPGAHISYSDRYEKTLKYAYSSNGGADWDTLTVPDPWDNVGLWNSIAVGVGDTVHISYSASDSVCEFKALKYTRGKPSW